MKKTMVKMLVVAGLFLSIQPAFHNTKGTLDTPWPPPDPNCAPAGCPTPAPK